MICARQTDSPGGHTAGGSMTVDGTALNTVHHFCYLNSLLSPDASLDAEIKFRLSKASSAFNRLKYRLWKDCGIQLSTKISVYRAVLSILLYGCKTWTKYWRHIKTLDEIHLRYVRQITHIKWEDKILNAEVLELCHIDEIEAFVMWS